ncbi:MAG: hypothetical protein M3R14_02020 [Acidobacteriota bacterium]|nr:hypothetical protein [Acidobacteriota bacterium]
MAEQARQNNLKIETYLEVFIEEKLNDDAETSTEEKEKPFYETATKEEWSVEFHRWLDSHKDKNYPVLPDEAYRRENIY